MKIKPKFLNSIVVSYPTTNIKYFKVSATSKYLIVLKIILLLLLFFLHNRNLFLTVLEAGKFKIKVSPDLDLGEGHLSFFLFFFF